MSQGKNKKLINKYVRRGDKSFPIATIAFYGENNNQATKLVCAIVETKGSAPDILKKWFCKNEIRKNEKVLGEVLSFIEEHNAKSVSMVEQIIGCPHEEGIDYPEGKPCPECSYWKNRDRFSHEIIH